MIRTDGLTFGLASIIIVGGADIAANLLDKSIRTAPHLTKLMRALADVLASFVYGGVLGTAVAVILAWVTLITVRQVGGEPALNTREMAKELASHGWLILIGGLLQSMATFAGFLLIVPGLILMTVWIVAVPALAAEGTSLRNAFGRSVNLTKGYRWQILALVIAYEIPFAIFNVATAVSVSGGRPIRLASAMPIVQFGVYPLAFALEYALSSAFIAALYVELVTLKDGGVRSAIVEAFA